MLQLTYISTIAPGSTRGVIDPILAASRRNNDPDGITGLLVFDGRRFLQVLEGDELVVRAAFRRIASDPRHRAIVTLSERATTAREFGPWAMACRLVDAPDQEGSMTAMVEVLTEDVPDASTRELFRSFARLKDAA